MDESLKARLIGAAVLVALAVILIPELLTGRKQVASGVEDSTSAGTRTVTIELGQPQEEGDAPAHSAAGPAAAPAVAPEATGAQASPPVEVPPAAGPTPEPRAPARAAAEPAPDRPVEPQAVAPAKESAAAAPRDPPVGRTGGYLVQVGAFGSLSSARKLATDLEKAGFRAFVDQPLKRGGKTLHPVRVGPEPDKAAADRLAVRLKARGLPTAVVAND